KNEQDAWALMETQRKRAHVSIKCPSVKEGASFKMACLLLILSLCSVFTSCASMACTPLPALSSVPAGYVVLQADEITLPSGANGPQLFSGIYLMCNTATKTINWFHPRYTTSSGCLLGRAISESQVGTIRAMCQTGSANLRNLGFTKSGNKYLHNLNGSGLKQGWVSTTYMSCGASLPIKRWKSRYTDDMMYGENLEWNTWYKGMVQDGGKVQFYIIKCPSVKEGASFKMACLLLILSLCSVFTSCASMACTPLPALSSVPAGYVVLQADEITLPSGANGPQLFSGIYLMCNTATKTISPATGFTLDTRLPVAADAHATNAQLWNVNYYYNYGVGVHAYCADSGCISVIQKNGIGYDMTNGKGLLGRAISESQVGTIRAMCQTGSANLRNLGFTKSGNKYLHNLNGSGLKQGWVSTTYMSCGASLPIKRWKSRYTDDMMYGENLEWNTWYKGMVQDGGKVQFYMWY
ncbi:hypothetical protein PRIPAC_86224, partial [Pristionchus pacificus]|uniref:Uncharacterized protein n=1 Tax=Pristionchus pacificus TaxID=54126 RepID=A0A2A6BTB3_PRIPA